MKFEQTVRIEGWREKERLPGELSEGENVRRAEAGADPIEDRSSVVVLERPFEAVGVQCVGAFVPQFAQQRAQCGSAHFRSESLSSLRSRWVFFFFRISNWRLIEIDRERGER